MNESRGHSQQHRQQHGNFKPVPDWGQVEWQQPGNGRSGRVQENEPADDEQSSKNQFRHGICASWSSGLPESGQITRLKGFRKGKPAFAKIFDQAKTNRGNANAGYGPNPE